MSGIANKTHTIAADRDRLRGIVKGRLEGRISDQSNDFMYGLSLRRESGFYLFPSR